MSLHTVTTNTPVGDFHMITDENDIVRASGFGQLSALIQRLPTHTQPLQIEEVKDHPYQKLVTAYFNGDRDALSNIPHNQDSTDFTKAVWSAMSKIPYGTTASYKELAEAAKRPTAVRAVGTTCGNNRLILLVPCHRVIKSDGSIGNYLYGTDIKERLLALERD